jgi:hypothetical protein
LVEANAVEQFPMLKVVIFDGNLYSEEGFVNVRTLLLSIYSRFAAYYARHYPTETGGEAPCEDGLRFGYGVMGLWGYG